MKKETTSKRAGSLVIDLAARTVTVDGTRVELPPAEFDLLAALAARPGEVVPWRDLLQLVWPDDPVMTNDDLRWRIWNIRKRIGDQERERVILGNRRGVGYLVDLPPKAVRVVERPADTDEQEAAHVVVLDDPEEDTAGDALAATPGPTGELEDEDDTQDQRAVIAPDPATSAPRFLRPAAVVVAAIVASALLGGSWLAGSWRGHKSARETESAAGRPAQGTSEGEGKDPEAGAKPDVPVDQSGTRPRPRARARNGDGPAQAGGGTGESAGSTAGQPPSTSEKSGSGESRSNRDGGSKATPAPQPDAQLFHLFNDASGDHFMTTSSSTANQKEAAGYTRSVESRVFSKQVRGTVGISLDDSTAYVYRNRDVVPQGVSVTELYRLTAAGDFFYTTSSAAANQARAQGWSRNLAGFVVP